MKNQPIKIVFGLIIFLFGSALAYFTANYVSASHVFDYWGTIAIFTGAYILAGIVVSSIFSVSLGFLFAADVLLLNLMMQYYGQWATNLKFLVIGFIIVVLYLAAGMRLKDKEPAPPVG